MNEGCDRDTWIDQRVHFELHCRQGNGVRFETIRMGLPDLDPDEIRASLVRLEQQGLAMRTLDPKMDRHLVHHHQGELLEMSGVSNTWYDLTACTRCGACCRKDVIVPLVESDLTPDRFITEDVGPDGERRRVMKKSGDYCDAYDEEKKVCTLHGTELMPFNCSCFVPGIGNESCVLFRRLEMAGGKQAYDKAQQKLSNSRFKRMEMEGEGECKAKGEYILPGANQEAPTTLQEARTTLAGKARSR